MNTIKTLPDGNLQITVEYVFVKRSGRKQIVMEEDRGDPENLDMGVIRALARGRYWNTKLDNGEYSTIREIAEVVGIDESYIARIIRLSTLSPFIVRMFLNGTSPSGLSLSKLLSTPLPDSWKEQHRMFGVKF